MKRNVPGIQLKSPRGHPLIRAGRWYLAVILLIILGPVAISLGEEKTHLTVINKTEHYLHLIISGNPRLYVAPHNSASYESDPTASIAVTAFYSPGQEVQGKITRTLEIPFTPADFGCTCRENGTFSCNPTSAVGGAATWEITADTMLVLTD